MIDGEGDTEWIRREANALGPLAKEPVVGGHRLEGEHQARLDETDHPTEAALDVLGALATEVPKDALDGAAPSVGVDPLWRSPRVSLTELGEYRSRNGDRRLSACLGSRSERTGVLNHRTVRRIVLGQRAEFALQLAGLARADPLRLEGVALLGRVLVHWPQQRRSGGQP